MKQYLEHMKTHSTHQRRTHAMQMAGSIMGAVFVIWLATLGFRLATGQVADQSAGDVSQTASVVQAQAGNATLLVATSTDSYTQ